MEEKAEAREATGLESLGVSSVASEFGMIQHAPL